MCVQLQNTCFQRNRQHTTLLRYSTFPGTPFALNTPHPVPWYQNQGQGEKLPFSPICGLFPGCCGWAALAPGMFPPLLLWPPVPRSAPWKRFAAYLYLPFFPISFLSVHSVSSFISLDCGSSSWALQDQVSDVLDSFFFFRQSCH